MNEESTRRGFLAAYCDLENKFHCQAQKDGNVFLPNFCPQSPVDVILVAGEPSFKWAKTDADARAQIEAGFRNFSYSFEDFVLHLSVRRFFLGEGENYHLTDISKGAMPVEHAEQDREERYARWLPLLKEEISLVAKPGIPIIAIGRPVAEELTQYGIPIAGTVLHYSGQAARHRTRAARERPEDFKNFKILNPITIGDVFATAEILFASAPKPPGFESRLERMRSKRRSLSDSIWNLLFTYYVCYQEIQKQRRHACGSATP